MNQDSEIWAEQNIYELKVENFYCYMNLCTIIS